jgi:uncharacterized protein YecA (UPF0149 family)
MRDQEQSELQLDIIEEAKSIDDAPQPFWLKKIPIRNGRIGVRRNNKCLCGSGKKFKACCLLAFKQSQMNQTNQTNQTREKSA